MWYAIPAVILVVYIVITAPAIAQEQAVERQSYPKVAVLQHIYDSTILKDSQLATDSLEQLRKQLQQQNKIKPDWLALQTSFKEFALHWKAVETLYIAGDLNKYYIDHARYIDYYHQGNESIIDQVNNALQGDIPIKDALFRHSSKGINALEVILFPEKTLSDQEVVRRLEGAKISVDNISIWLAEIHNFYRVDKSFVTGGKTSLSLLVNRLVDSSYKLAYWRIGEAAGLTPKSKGKLHPKSLEFQISDMTKASIERILLTHQKVLKNRAGMDLYSIGHALGVADDMVFLQERMNASLAALAAIPEPFAEQLQTADYKNLFEELSMLHNSYYFMLINNLGLEARILEADGD